MKKKYSLIGAAILMAANVAQAADTGRADFTWNGFLTAGAAFSDSPTLYNEDTDNNGNFSDARFGLNVSAALPRDWRIAGQLISHEGEESLNLDWGYASYRPRDTFAFNVGKLKYPNSLVSEYFDVGFSQPWTHAPEEFYTHTPLGPQFIFESFSGVSAIFKTAPGAGFQYALQPFVGDANIEDGKQRKLVGVKVSAAREGVELIAGYARSLLELDAASPRFAEANDRYKDIVNVGALIDYRHVLVYAEYGVSAVKDVPEFDTQAGYITLGYQLDKFLPHVTFGYFDQDSGLGQTSGTLGLKYTLNNFTAVKFQWQNIDPKVRTAALAGGDQPSGLFAAQPAEDRVNVVGAAIDFVF